MPQFVPIYMMRDTTSTMGRGMEQDAFLEMVQEISNVAEDRPFDVELERVLNIRYGCAVKPGNRGGKVEFNGR